MCGKERRGPALSSSNKKTIKKQIQRIADRLVNRSRAVSVSVDVAVRIVYTRFCCAQSVLLLALASIHTLKDVFLALAHRHIYTRCIQM